MKKVFRMKYEPCNGECYVPDDVINLSFLSENLIELKKITAKLIKAHEPLCGDENLAYAIDFDDVNKLFIGTFLHYRKLELFCGKDMLSVLNELCDAAITHFASPEGLRELKSAAAQGHDVCEHGKDEDLLHFMIKHSGISTPNGVEAFINEMKSG